MASGHMNRVKRPDTWLHRPMLQNVKKVLANPEPSTQDPKRASGGNDFASETRGVCRSSVSRKSFSLKITKPTEPCAPARICISPDTARSGSFSRDPREEELR